MLWLKSRSALALALLLVELGGCGGGERDLPPALRNVPVPYDRLATPQARARGRALFVEHCALCHGERADGQGARAQLAPPAANFTDPTWRARMTPLRAYAALRGGVRGTAMPAWPALTDGDCWDLVAYVLSVHETGP